AGADDRDPVADQRPGVPQGVDRGLHRAGEDGTLRRDVVGNHCHGVGRHDVRRLVGEQTEDGAPPELCGTPPRNTSPSVPRLTPDRSVRTSTSPGPGSGSATVRISPRPGSAIQNARASVGTGTLLFP